MVKIQQLGSLVKEKYKGKDKIRKNNRKQPYDSHKILSLENPHAVGKAVFSPKGSGGFHV